MTLYAAIDLHSNNNYLVVIDERDQVAFRRKQANVLELVQRALEPFREQLAGIVVESTYNWYWLVDGLMESGWKVHLANTAATQQYEGIKLRNDWTDAQWLAHLLRLGIMPEGYIYPKGERSVRDLLRERLRLVQERSRQILSLEGTFARQRGIQLNSRRIRELDGTQLEKCFAQDLMTRQAAEARLAVFHALQEQITKLEKSVDQQVQMQPDYERLQTVWGVGKVLSRTILLETGPVGRFEQEGNYLSYCRMVESKKWTNGKKKGEGNRKCGNRYLCWAYMEAAHFACRYYPSARSFVDRKTVRGHRVLGLKALASKLCRASYFVLRDQVEFDPNRLFGSTGRSRPESRTIGVGVQSRQI
jgi:transposase